MLDIIHREITRFILLRWDLPLGGGNLYEYMQASLHHLSLRRHLKSFGATHKIQEFNYELIEDRFKGATRLEGSSYKSESIIILR